MSRGGIKSSTHRRAVVFAIVAGFVLAPACQAALTESQPVATEQTDKAPEIPTVESLLAEPDKSEQAAADPMASDETTSAAPSTATTEPAQTALPTTAMMPTVPVAKPAAPAKVLPPMTQVKLHYKNGKFRDALNVIATMKPTELTHYYAGLCYQGQGQLTQAAQEFNYTASIAKDATIRYMAQSALRSVSNYSRARTYSGQGNQFARATYTNRGGATRSSGRS